MARHDASELTHRLARDAESVCRHYLSAGRREGRYWLVGDVRNTPGRSMFVRLKESPRGPAGKWTDYVAPRVMLRPCTGRRCCEGSAASPQHNVSASGRVA
ncbi:hypothetical protein GGQ98_000356 [Sphingosinicella soli]|uniref:DNA primase n=1 Tax=Sphingosinicella soli TaxID=333708 RepID=A0A7W7B0D6_9SPHN|nr:hypothetical protein [Sphingosinicella soli]